MNENEFEINDLIYGLGAGAQAYATQAMIDSSAAQVSPNQNGPMLVEETETDYTIHIVIGVGILFLIGIILYVKFS